MTEKPTLRPYDPEADREALWELKRAFETGLGAEGGDEKAATYESKLTDEYRREWLAWVDRCVADDERCVTLAVADGEAVGYVFVLPERLAFVWDAAVVNELFVAPDYRGSGVAEALLEAAVGLATEQDLPLDRLLLDVDPANERAYAFYEKLGFEPWGEIVAREL
ncbi:GNAT family N-acetyltransferase [Natronomonas sp. CBA1123]|uniref:GNAT family N-acetyltransferase n=1 Tax=Natronomonas sp. CBA1123 TaxID=2668070 RepID=UPI0012EA26A6|nr:GNAT family N-acetyltransferase [Natronomonas sp. CBA1123]MUV85267.1 GNAT family N-acetyltransferase [Natronomonas sp. CBA1123]